MTIIALWTILTLFPVLVRLVSGTVTQTPKRRPVFLPDSTNFEEIANCYAFVDKTHFIRAFFEYRWINHHIFTRPRKFGKTTNMDMLKRFVQLEVDQYGRIKKQNETSAYRLFTNRTLNLQISHFTPIMDEHLGKYPVIHIEFKGVMRDTVNETLKSIRERVRKACEPYEWMIGILHEEYHRTNESAIGQQVRFLKKAIYGTMNLDITTKSLCLLAKVLLNYFRRELFVFIDDYDVAIDYSLRYSHRRKAYDLTKIRSVVRTMVEKLFGEPLQHIKYIMITGTALGSSSTFNSFEVNNFQHHGWLSDTTMRTFFGFTENEVTDTMVRRRIQETEKHRIIEYYNGYFTSVKNIRMYNANSVLNYMGSFKKNNITYPSSWIDPGDLDFMQQAIKNPKLYLFWLQILLQKDVNLQVKSYVDEARILKLGLKLRNNSTNLTPADIDAFLWYCKENGYIVTKMDSSQQPYLVLPNKEIHIEFTTVLFRYYDSLLPNITAPLTETFKNLAKFINIDDEVPKLKRLLGALVKSEFKFDDCKELHYYAIIYHSIASYFKDVFTDVRVLRQDTAYYIVICETEEVIVIAVKYERGIRKALRQAFNYHTDVKLTKGKNIRFIGIKIDLKSELASIAYFSPYNRISVCFAIESEEREEGLYDMFQVF
ncbi:uncharacterized protein LOC135849898 [Planococcus citri]|uniref:uncharacterized protein LOC135849898 n=1 Tax=Planococcus citri TaxID=170843 RepID=UPI0031FA11A3